VIYLIALVLLAGFVAVTLVDRRRKHRRPAVAIQRTDPDPPGNPDPAPDPDPDPAPDAWPPTR
jgi:hypothetical protein